MNRTSLPLKAYPRWPSVILAILLIAFYSSLLVYAAFSYSQAADPKDLTISFLSLSLLFAAFLFALLAAYLRRQRLSSDLKELDELTRELALEKEIIEPFAPIFHRLKDRYQSILYLNPNYPFYADYLSDLARSLPDSLFVRGPMAKKEAELELHFLRLLDRLNRLAFLATRSPSLIKGKEEAYLGCPNRLIAELGLFIRGFPRFDALSKFPFLSAFSRELALP